jgi:hypothetical protein
MGSTEGLRTNHTAPGRRRPVHQGELAENADITYA